MKSRARAALLAALATAAASGCGQQGPLVLPEGARPIERAEAPTEPGSEPNDDERRNDR